MGRQTSGAARALPSAEPGRKARLTDRAKVTISISSRSLGYADRRAASRGTTRSLVIEELLRSAEQTELDEAAAEGYRLFAQESADWAASFPPVFTGDPDGR